MSESRRRIEAGVSAYARMKAEYAAAAAAEARARAAEEDLLASFGWWPDRDLDVWHNASLGNGEDGMRRRNEALDTCVETMLMLGVVTREGEKETE